MDRIAEARLTLEEWSRSPECQEKARLAARGLVEDWGVVVWGVRGRRHIIYRRRVRWIFGWMKSLISGGGRFGPKEVVTMTRDVDNGSHCERDNGAEDCEIEITPEMIEAGVGELCGYDRNYESMEEAVTRIFMAMASASGCR